MTKEDFELWTDEICQVFSKESKEIYYNPYEGESKKHPNGKLFDKYNNLKKWMNRHKKVEHEKKTLTENDENALKNLKNLSAEETALKELWKNTFLIRERKKTIHEYFEDYPVLKTALGIELVCVKTVNSLF